MLSTENSSKVSEPILLFLKWIVTLFEMKFCLVHGRKDEVWKIQIYTQQQSLANWKNNLNQKVLDKTFENQFSFL